jgi:PAS domain S-box-containing protein
MHGSVDDKELFLSLSRFFRRGGAEIFVCFAGIMASYFLFDLIQSNFDHLSPEHEQDHGELLVHLGWVLPYIAFFTGTFVTITLAFYLYAVRQHDVRLRQLTLSLSQANEELNNRITDEARLARALQASEQRHRDLFENAGIGICQIAPSGEWFKANHAIALILGYGNAHDLLAAQPDVHRKLFAHADDRREWFTRLREGNQRGFECEFLTRGGHRIWVSLSGYAVQDGNASFYECMINDITERRRSELALIKAKEDADFANRSKSEFLANMSHELRTPLNAIIGFAEIIKGEMFGPSGQPQYVEYARDIYDSGDLLLSLINDILDMSKMEASKRTLSEVVLNMEKTIDAAVRLVSVRAKASKLHLNVVIPKDLPAFRGEEKALKQILMNLLTNAIKFTPEGGEVTLRALLDDKRRLVIRVEDTGIGIAQEDIPTAMAPFGQIESVLSRKHQGTGLGLPMAKALTELHGGTLELVSRVGGGTVAIITFPADRVMRKLEII